MLDQVLAWIGANIGLTETLVAVLGLIVLALAKVGGVIAWFVGLFQKPEVPSVTQNVKVQTQPTLVSIDADAIPDGATGKVTLTLEAYEARIKQARDEAQAQIPDASGEHLKLLTAKRDEYESRLSDIELAFEKSKARIVELEGIIEREGNLLGAADLAEAEVALANGDFDAAEKLLARIEDQGDLEVKRTARAAYGRGQIAEEQVRWLDAADHYSKAARLDPNYDNLNKAGEFLYRAGRYEEALRTGQNLLALSKREQGDDAEETAAALNNLALWHRSLGQYDEAEPLFRQAIKIGKATIGETHPHYAIGLNNLAALLENMGRYDEAEPLYRQVIEIEKATIGETHPNYAISLGNLAGLLTAMGRIDEAEPLRREEFKIMRDFHGDVHPHVATATSNLAVLLRRTGRFEEAEPLFRQAIKIDKATIGELHPDYATRLNNLAVLLEAMKRFEEARPLFAQAIKIDIDQLGKDHLQSKADAWNYADLLRADFPDDPALAELEATFGPDIGK